MENLSSRTSWQDLKDYMRQVREHYILMVRVAEPGVVLQGWGSGLGIWFFTGFGSEF